MDSLRKYLAEIIGTFVLVVFGCGTAIVTGCGAEGGMGAYALTALAFGLVIVAMAYSIGNISGCHINPAVSLAMFINKKMSLTDMLLYWASQVVGACAGAFLLSAFFNPEESGFGTNGLFQDEVAKSFLIEGVLTFVFILAILGVTSKIENGNIAGLVIGLTLTLVHILGIGFTGTSVNPARSIGPALFKGGEALENVWIFIVAPLVGAAFAAIIYRFLDPSSVTSEKKAAKKEEKKEAA
ncbi:MAG: aquaporin [Clostridiales bacterium]|nr:aquaporin [Clostridiales bacterium]MBR6254164.1 aquaporin [Clostridiales bacterium]